MRECFHVGDYIDEAIAALPAYECKADNTIWKQPFWELCVIIYGSALVHASNRNANEGHLQPGSTNTVDDIEFEYLEIPNRRYQFREIAHLAPHTNANTHTTRALTQSEHLFSACSDQKRTFID